MKSFEIGEARKRQLLDGGCVALPQALSPGLLSRLRRMADRLEAEALAEHAAGRTPGHAAIFDTAGGAVTERLWTS